MKIKIDLSKFKLHSNDGKIAVLEHPDGHKVHVAVHALHPMNRKNLGSLKLAEGGEVKESKKDKEEQNPRLDPDKVKEFQEHSIFNSGHKTKRAMAKGGKVEYDKLKHPEPKDPVEYEPYTAEHPVDYEEIKEAKKPKMAEGGEAPEADAPIPPQSPDLSQLGARLSALPGGASPEATPALAPAAPAPVAAPAPPSSSVPFPQAEQAPPEADTMHGYEQQVQGMQGEANAKAQESQAQTKALAQQLSSVQKLTSDYQDHYQHLDDERKAFQEDIINKHIDPQHYLGSLDTEGRFNTAVGLILGGLGGGGNSNQALDFLNRQIDRDIAAQQADLGKKETLLSANMRQFGNLKDATEMTKVMQNDMLITKLKQAEAKASNPLAKANAQQKIGQLEMQVAPMVQQLATRRMLSQINESGDTSKLDPAKLIPSVVPEKEQASAFKELQEAQNMSTAKENILGAFNKLSTINTAHNRLVSPIQTARQVAALKDPLVAELSKATAGRFTEQDAAMLDTLFPKYLDTEAGLATKKEQIEKLISEKMHFPVLNAYGLNPEKFESTTGDQAAKLSPQQQSFAKYARENPQDPRSALILKKLGL